MRRSLTLQNLELSQRRRHRHGHMEWRSTIAGIPNAIDMEFERSSQGSSISTNALTEELRTQSLDRRMLKNKKRSYFTRRGISILSSLRLRKNSKLTLPPSEEEVLDQSSLKQLDQLPVSSWTGSLPRNVKLNADRTRNGSAQRGRIMNRWSGDYSTSDGMHQIFRYGGKKFQFFDQLRLQKYQLSCCGSLGVSYLWVYFLQIGPGPRFASCYIFKIPIKL